MVSQCPTPSWRCAEQEHVLTGRCRKYLEQIRRNPGPFTNPEAVEEEFLAQFERFKILYVLQSTSTSTSTTVATKQSRMEQASG